MLVDRNSFSDIQMGGADPDLSEFINTDLFLNAPSSSTSRASSPQSPFQSLLTPPQTTPVTSFPDIYDEIPDPVDSATSLFNLIEDDLKLSEPQVQPYDFYGTLREPSVESDSQASMGIDPQLVDSPSAQEDEAEETVELPIPQEEPPQQKLTVTIAPIKTAGHGKSRKGTVHSGGVTKKTATASALPPQPTAPIYVAPPTPITAASVLGKRDLVDDDELPADWRPPPEVFAKMSSKEKRQLRNKISARNFRVRRKEYISTLEMDIAERDRLLNAIRAELGNTQSENQALRQEIAALKRALLDGKSASELKIEDIPVLNLPPPGPLPSTSAPRTSSPAPALLTPNTQKDVGSSSAGSFWGGVRMGGGITPVHTVLMPENVGKPVQKDTTPAMPTDARVRLPTPLEKLSTWDGLPDNHPLGSKHFDLHRWSKSNSYYPPSPPLSRPSSPRAPDPRFSPSPFSKQTLPYLGGSPFGQNSPPLNGAGFRSSTPSSLLAGKHRTSPPSSPRLPSVEDQQLKVAALAQQTLMHKLASAFLETFASATSAGMDVERVCRVLEGKSKLQLVDEERAEVCARTVSPEEQSCALTAMLEEGIQGLSLSSSTKKSSS
ncbi:hypothetical protein CYLTODRAFT_488144 [Cylindrobasidium torrendii FP15055 ss-10]|uniref:BZIP domain-containing protein n=1 Tax=Cylindrobasidium torrendii FP15055 ss-10 TaxID=1314674 RepID=A0A0D7BIR6_9AGAR|nr:hypothetical protein CYLTODRAFT_488144 [Cylindrobasidium torrendii FP15055 ss-10]